MGRRNRTGKDKTAVEVEECTDPFFELLFYKFFMGLNVAFKKGYHGEEEAIEIRGFLHEVYGGLQGSNLQQVGLYMQVLIEFPQVVAVEFQGDALERFSRGGFW